MVSPLHKSGVRVRLHILFRFIPLFAAVALDGDDHAYRSVSIDENGQLHIVLDSGRNILPKKLPGQISFDAPLLSADSRAVGWLALFADPGPPSSDNTAAPLPLRLVLYRAGRVIRTFATEPIFWDWRFQDGGKRVAYSTGPTHGGANECVLRDVGSGHIVAHWTVTSQSEPPLWARELRR